jgi:hypothetical protein
MSPTTNPAQSSNVADPPDEWPIPQDMRGGVVARQLFIAIKSEMKPADSIAAARCLVTMNGQTLAAKAERQPEQIHRPGNANVLINATPEERRLRLAAIDERLRARRMAALAPTGRNGSGPDRAPGAQNSEGAGGGQSP